MKKFLKLLKILAIIAASLAVVVYGGVFLGHKVVFKEVASDVPTVQPAQNAEFTLGAQAHTQPGTMDEYVELLAQQIRRYNEVAPGLWADNALVNQSAVVEALDDGKIWLISPDGSVTPLTKKDLLERGVLRVPHFNGFGFFDGGVYLAVSQDDMKNYLIWQQYLLLGVYDPFITFVHESFHGPEQERWENASHLSNASERGEYLDNLPARAKRALLQKQLLAAIAEPEDPSLVLDALATYEDYKAQFPDDYKNSVHTDRIEGTAYYYELISCLYASYPQQVKDRESLDRALALLATRQDIYVNHGLTTEGYNIGGFACILLDRFESGWQERLMKDGEATPIELLSQRFSEADLPAPHTLTQEEIDATKAEIEQEPEESSGVSLLFKMLYSMLF